MFAKGLLVYSLCHVLSQVPFKSGMFSGITTDSYLVLLYVLTYVIARS